MPNILIETSIEKYTGDGVSVSFPIPFFFISTDDVKIKRVVDGVEIEETPQSISGAGLQDGGAVVLNTALNTGETLIVYRSPSLIQPALFSEQLVLPPESVERGFNRATAQIQSLALQLSRALMVPIAFSGGSYELPAPEAAALIGFDSDGTGLTLYTAADLGEGGPVGTGGIADHAVTNEKLSESLLSRLLSVEQSVLNIKTFGRFITTVSGTMYVSKSNGDNDSYAAVTGVESLLSYGVKKKVADDSSQHWQIPPGPIMVDIFGAGGGGGYTTAGGNGTPTTFTYNNVISSAYAGLGGSEAYGSAASGKAGGAGVVGVGHNGVVIPGGGAPGGIGAAQDIGPHAALSQSGSAGGRVSLEVSAAENTSMGVMVGVGGASTSSNPGRGGFAVFQFSTSGGAA